MKHSLLFAAVMVLGLPAGTQAKSNLTWKYDGYSKLPAAAAEAKRTNRRLLIGLSGSST